MVGVGSRATGDGDTSLVESLERLSELLDDVVTGRRSHAIELHHRRSERLRVTWHRGAAEPDRGRATVERGSAVRVEHDVARTIGFSATTGLGPAALRWALDRAEAGTVRPVGGHPRIEVGTDRPGLDADRSVTRPGRERLAAWIESTRDGLLALAPDALRLEIVTAWIEVGRTVELLANTRGLRTARSRDRTWALLECRVDVGDRCFQRPLTLATRGFDALPGVEGLASLLDAWRFAGREFEPPAGPVVFAPRSSARLVRALCAAVHFGGLGRDLRVGPGWCLEDRPTGSGALFGGALDDTGHRTEVVSLADGRTGIDRSRQRGHAWRPSFRDPPSPRPSHVVVPGSEHGLPDRGTVVHDVRILPLASDDWVLGGVGVAIVGGRPGDDGGVVHFRASPFDLAARCVGACGEAWPSPHGVVTPALVFDDIEGSGA